MQKIKRTLFFLENCTFPLRDLKPLVLVSQLSILLSVLSTWPSLRGQLSSPGGQEGRPRVSHRCVLGLELSACCTSHTRPDLRQGYRNMWIFQLEVLLFIISVYLCVSLYRSVCICFSVCVSHSPYTAENATTAISISQASSWPHNTHIYKETLRSSPTTFNLIACHTSTTTFHPR